MKKFAGLLAVLLLAHAVCGRPSDRDDEDDYDENVAEPEKGIQNDNYEYPEAEDEDAEPEIPDPILVTRSQHLIAKQNETVHLPCQLENADTLVNMWKKNNELIFQDSIRFNNIGNNYKVVNRTLIISDLGANETANYTCFIPLTKTESMSVTHVLTVHTAPQIVSLKAQHDIVQLDAGKTLVLTCKATGHPPPTIKWSRKGHRLADEGETVFIENIGHHDAGDYQCLADNNIEPPAHQYIHIGVTHKPIVKIEKIVVNSDHNLDEQLVCYVHAVPKADVIWQKDGLNLVSNDHIHFRNHNHTHILEIKKIQASDLGIYTCSARNRVGRTDKNVTLTTYPSPAKHVKTIHDSEKNVLIWEVDSKAPITKYALEYKKVSESDWKAASPEVSNADGNIYTVNHTLEHLPGGHYEARLRSKNYYGWSDWSDIVKFKSERHHKASPHIQKPEQVTQNEEIVYKPHHEQPAIENEVLNTEKPVVPVNDAAAEAPVEHKENTEQKPHTQEQQHQAAVGGNNPDGAAAIAPWMWLLCIALVSAIYSH